MGVPERDTTFGVFIDYDNLQPEQKAAGILDVVTKALIQYPVGCDHNSRQVRRAGIWRMV